MKTVKRGNIDMTKVLKDAQDGIKNEELLVLDNPEAVNALTKD